MSIKGGSIYYTVGIDRKSLASAMQQIQALGKAAASANGAYAKGNSVLSQYEDEVRKVSRAIKTLNNDFNAGSKDPEKHRIEMEKLEQDALSLRQAIENLGSSVVATSQDQARAANMVKSLSGSLKETSSVVAGNKGQYDMLGNELADVQVRLVGLNAEVRRATQTFEAGNMSATEYAATLNKLKAKFDATGAEVKQMTAGLSLNAKASTQVSRAHGQVTRGLTAIQKGTTRATGSMTNMALAQQLSYGGMTLLNDRIFQMSPALGILTNQLMFTTKGFKAWLAAMLPILAVAGSIIAALSAMVIGLRSGSGLEVALANVRKTTNLTTAELEDLTGRFQGLAKEVPISTMELLEMAKVAGQLGIKGVDNIERFSATVAKLAIATDVVGEEGATSLARFLQATGTAMDEMGQEAERAANVLNELENNTAATADEILQMTSYTQGLTAQSGFTKDEILGLNAALLSLGVKAEAGGSAVVRTMGKIQVAGSTGGDALARFAEEAGISVELFRDMARNSPVDAFMALTKGLNETAESGGNLNDVLSALGIVEVRERRALLALAQGYDTLDDAMRTASVQSRLMNSLQAEVEIQSDTLVSKLKMLGARFVTIGQNIGQVLVPVAKALVDLLITLADNFDTLAIAALAAGVALGATKLGAVTVMATTLFGRLAVAVRGVSNAMLTMRLALASGGLANLVAVLGAKLAAMLALVVSLPGAIAILAALVTGGLYVAFRRWHTSTVELTEATEEAAEAVSRFNDIGVLVADTLVELTEATDESGFRGALDTLISTLDDEGKVAMMEFANSVLAPLLAQGELAEATRETTLAILEQRQAMADTGYNENFTLMQAIEAQLRRAEQRLDDQLVAIRETEARGGSIDPSILAERRAEVNRLTVALEDQRAVVAASAAGYGAINLAIEELTEGGLSAEEVVANLQRRLEELAGVSPVGSGTDGDGDGPDKIAEAWARLAAVRAEIAEKAKAYGWDEQQRAEAMASAVSSAIDELIGLGVRLNNTSLAGLVAEWRDLKDGILSAEVALEVFETQLGIWASAQERRFSGENGEMFTISAIARSAGTFKEAMDLLERAGLDADRELLELVSSIRGEGIPAFYAVRESTDEASKGFEGLKVKAGRAAESFDDIRTSIERYVDAVAASGIGRARVGGFSQDRADTGAAAAPNWQQWDADQDIAEQARIGAARAAYYTELARIEAMYAAKRMTWEGMVTAKLAAKNALIDILVTSTRDYADSVAVLTGEVENLEDALENITKLQDKLNVATKYGEGENNKAKRTVDDKTRALEEEAAQILATTAAYSSYNDEYERLDALLEYGLIDNVGYLQGELSAAEALFEDLADSTGLWSKATEEAAAAVAMLRAEIEKLNAYEGTSGLKGNGRAGNPAPAKGDNPRDDQTTSYGINFGPASNMLMTFVNALGAAAAESDVMGSVFASWKTVTDENGKIMSAGLDPMMLLFQVIGKVVGRSEKFAEALDLLDTILDPLVVAFDALFGAIMPTIEVIVALVTTALKPFVYIVENVLAPVLEFVANTIKAIWNALAAVIPWMNPTTDSGAEEGFESDNNPGSIAYARERQAWFERQWEEAANEEERAAARRWADFWQGVVDRRSGNDPVEDDEDSPGNVSAGTQISTITGPTRDLLVDLLRPLSILPSWTGMIQDIRNDIRSIASAGGFAPMAASTTATAVPVGTNVTNNAINIQNLTVQTQATNARQLFNEISTIAYRDRRGGK